MKYPIGIQSFEKLRTGGFVYVDKTDLIYNLTENFQYVFLGRPRRFGKSLLMSTVQAYFEGRRDLFEGLAIDSLAGDWTAHPVLHFDLNTGNYQDNGVDELAKTLDYQLSQYEKLYGGIDSSLTVRFLNVIRCAKEATGKKVVVLIDEYDKPILSTLGTKAESEIRGVLKSFYSCLKSSDEYIRFAMLTGVSKFGKLSVFSDLNNIKDISMLSGYASICGITKQEILNNFSESIAEFADSEGIGYEDIIERLRQKYDGYRFSKANTLVFNPFSLLNAFADRELRDYWFESGTPTFLVKLLQQNGYDLTKIDDVMVGEESLYQVDNVSAVPILYQSGYLTIKEYISEASLYKLGYPNSEVENGFMNFLLPYYSQVSKQDTRSELYKLTSEIKSGDVEAFMTRLRSIFRSVPYATDKSMKAQEDQVRNLAYIIFKLLGFSIQAECHMANGRSDAVVWTSARIYVFEFKVDSTADAALRQIRDKGYAEPYLADGREITIIGINYSTAERAITEWKAENIGE